MAVKYQCDGSPSCEEPVIYGVLTQMKNVGDQTTIWGIHAFDSCHAHTGVLVEKAIDEMNTHRDEYMLTDEFKKHSERWSNKGETLSMELFAIVVKPHDSLK